MKSTKFIENPQPLPKPARNFSQVMPNLTERPLVVARVVEELQKKAGLRPSDVVKHVNEFQGRKRNINTQPTGYSLAVRSTPKMAAPPPLPQTPTSPQPVYDRFVFRGSPQVGPKPEDLIVLQRFFGLKTPLQYAEARRLACSSNSERSTPLHQAARESRSDVVAALIRLGAPIEARDSCGYRPVHKAAAAGSVKVLQQLRISGADLQAEGTSGYRPLHRAAVNGAMEAVQWLVEQGTPVDVTISGGWTSLHLAVWWDREPVVRCLLQLGASVSYLTDQGCSPLDLAIAGQYHDLARIIISYGGTVE